MSNMKDHALELLTTGCVTLDTVAEGVVIVIVRDGGREYKARWRPNRRWDCSCGARHKRCVHTFAAAWVTPIPQRQFGDDWPAFLETTTHPALRYDDMDADGLIAAGAVHVLEVRREAVPLSPDPESAV